MSYEGYEQCICTDGHYFDNHDLYGGMYNDEEKPLCPTCQKPAAWENQVDQTNGPSQGEVPYETLKEKFLVKPAVHEVCNLGHSHEMSPDVFRIPTREECEPLRVYHNEEDHDNGCMHENQYINDRNQSVCPDCGEELGR